MISSRLTPKQNIVLAAVRELQAVNGETPTLDEIRAYLSYSKVSSVQRHIEQLKLKGYIGSEKHQARSLNLIHQSFVSIPLVGNVACGTPMLAQENIEAYVNYGNGKIKGDPKDYFFLRARGDSMDDAGIDDGDLVLVHKQDYADEGKNVVALIDDNATIKRFKKENGYWTLEPVSKNPTHKKIVMVEDFTIQGMAVDVIKAGRLQ
jgi:repressor LexA